MPVSQTDILIAVITKKPSVKILLPQTVYNKQKNLRKKIRSLMQPAVVAQAEISVEP